jgi:hypothetical protein
MATEFQIDANRENESPLWGESLFAANNCVHLEEKEEYENFCSALWSTLAPAGPVEGAAAAEFVRNAWRLRRCATDEETLGKRAARFQASQNKTNNTNHPAGDPMIYPEFLPAQNAIDRARTSAHNGMRRAKANLDKMQAARKTKPTAVLQFKPNPTPDTGSRKARPKPRAFRP